MIGFTYEKNPSVTSLFQFILPFLILAVVCGITIITIFMILESFVDKLLIKIFLGVFTETNAEGNIFKVI